MKRIKKIIMRILNILFSVLLLTVFFKQASFADWWERPDNRPTQPSIERDLPTTAPQPTTIVQDPTVTVKPTSKPDEKVTLSPTPTTIRIGGEPTVTEEDACAPGKSFDGPYCGWSPSVDGVDGEGGIGGDGGQGAQAEILGLSYTSGRDLEPSDIMFLAGILCLLMYLKSKLNLGKQLSKIS